MPIAGSRMGTSGYGGGTKDKYKKPRKGTKTVRVGKGGKWKGKK
jgi:hypothetical protein